MKSAKESLDGFVLPASEGVRKYVGITAPVGRVGLTCMLYFRGGHLPEIQANACECIREYARIVGKEARSCLTPSTRLVRAGKKGLPLMDEKEVSNRQERGEWTASFLISSITTRKEFACSPPAYMLRAGLYLNNRIDIRYQGKRPGMPLPIPLDRQVSYLFASFEPSLFLREEPPLSFAELVLKWCRALRPVNGTAGWGITRVCYPAGAEAVRPFIAPYLLRHPGLIIPDAFYPQDFTEHIVDINWLTMINAELAARIGGPERLKSLGEDCPVRDYPGGYVIQAGPRPELGDRDKGDIPPFYGAVHELLRPLYLPSDYLDYLTTAVVPPDAGPDFNLLFVGFVPEAKKYLHAFFAQWLHRFEK